MLKRIRNLLKEETVRVAMIQFCAIGLLLGFLTGLITKPIATPVVTLISGVSLGFIVSIAGIPVVGLRKALIVGLTSALSVPAGSIISIGAIAIVQSLGSAAIIPILLVGGYGVGEIIRSARKKAEEKRSLETVTGTVALETYRLTRNFVLEAERIGFTHLLPQAELALRTIVQDAERIKVLRNLQYRCNGESVEKKRIEDEIAAIGKEVKLFGVEIARANARLSEEKRRRLAAEISDGIERVGPSATGKLVTEMRLSAETLSEVEGLTPEEDELARKIDALGEPTPKELVPSQPMEIPRRETKREKHWTERVRLLG